MGVYLLDADFSAAGIRALRRVRRVQQDLSRDRAPAGRRQRPAATPCATYARRRSVAHAVRGHVADGGREEQLKSPPVRIDREDRKSTRLNSSHLGISYA